MTSYDIQNNILYSAVWNGDIEKYTIPSNVIQIADGNDQNSGAFSQFKDKKFSISFGVGSQIETIGEYSFYGCALLQSIDFSNANSLKTIRGYAFNSCSSLTSVTFPQSLETFSYRQSFALCSSLTKVTFPSGSKLTTITIGTFNSCPLTSFQLPKKVAAQNSLGPAFHLTQIKAFTIEGNAGENLAIYEGSVYSKDFTTLYVYHKGTDFKLHPDTTTLAQAPFSGSKCPHLIIPETITNFQASVFQEFRGAKITMLSTPETINDYFFHNCINLEELVLCEGLKSITYTSYQAIYTNGRLKTMYIPYSLESIDYRGIGSKDFKACFYGNVDVIKQSVSTLPNYKVNNCYIGIKISINNNRHICFSKSISNFLFVLSSSV